MLTRRPLRSRRTCRWCGCREDRACVVPDGDGGFEPCHWVGPRTCSNPECVRQAREAMRGGEKGLMDSPRKRQAMRHTTKDGREICRSSWAWLLRRREVHARDGGRCVECGRAVALADAQIDHIRGRGMGGGFRNDAPENLRTMCLACHWGRHGQRMEQVGLAGWLAEREAAV